MSNYVVSIANLERHSPEDLLASLTDADLERYRDAMGEEKGIVATLFSGEEVHLIEKIAGGGSKTIYSTDLGEGDIVVAVPNIVPRAQEMRAKWQASLNEVPNAHKLQELGILVNPDIDYLYLLIGNIPMPAIRMRAYDSLPFTVLDNGPGRTADKSFLVTSFFQKRPHFNANDPSLASYKRDIVTLLRQGIGLMGDSINAAMCDEGLRLYFNDLITIPTIENPSSIKGWASKYANRGFEAIVRHVGIAYYDNRAFWDGLCEPELPFQQELVSSIVSAYNSLESSI